MKQYKYLGTIVAFYITLLLVSDLSAGKLTTLFGYTVPVAVFYFPLTFLLGDVLTEVYGYSRARSVAWTAFFCTILASLIYQFAVYLPPAAGFEANEAYARVLGVLPRVAISSVIAVWVGTMLNDYVMAKMKVWTNGKHLWTRTISSTIVGQGVATALFFTMGLGGIIPGAILISSILSGWFFKVAVEVIFTPVTYAVSAWLKRAESEDYYDRDTDFNPFIVQVTKL